MHCIAHLEGEAIRAVVRRPAFSHDWREYPRTTPAELDASEERSGPSNTVSAIESQARLREPQLQEGLGA